MKEVLLPNNTIFTNNTPNDTSKRLLTHCHATKTSIQKIYLEISNQKCFFMNTARIWAPISICNFVFESPKKETFQKMWVTVRLKLWEQDAVEIPKILVVHFLRSTVVIGIFCSTVVRLRPHGAIFAQNWMLFGPCDVLYVQFLATF